MEVKQLETAIDNLRGDCDEMSKKVTHLTAGKGKLLRRVWFIEAISDEIKCTDRQSDWKTV